MKIDPEKARPERLEHLFPGVEDANKLHMCRAARPVTWAFAYMLLMRMRDLAETGGLVVREEQSREEAAVTQYMKAARLLEATQPSGQRSERELRALREALLRDEQRKVFAKANPSCPTPTLFTLRFPFTETWPSARVDGQIESANGVLRLEVQEQLVHGAGAFVLAGYRVLLGYEDQPPFAKLRRRFFESDRHPLVDATGRREVAPFGDPVSRLDAFIHAMLLHNSLREEKDGNAHPSSMKAAPDSTAPIAWVQENDAPVLQVRADVWPTFARALAQRVNPLLGEFCDGIVRVRKPNFTVENRQHPAMQAFDTLQTNGLLAPPNVVRRGDGWALVAGEVPLYCADRHMKPVAHWCIPAPEVRDGGFSTGVRTVLGVVQSPSGELVYVVRGVPTFICDELDFVEDVQMGFRGLTFGSRDLPTVVAYLQANLARGVYAQGGYAQLPHVSLVRRALGSCWELRVGTVQWALAAYNRMCADRRIDSRDWPEVGSHRLSTVSVRRDSDVPAIRQIVREELVRWAGTEQPEPGHGIPADGMYLNATQGTDGILRFESSKR